MKWLIHGLFVWLLLPATSWAAVAYVQSKEAVACCSQSSLAITATSNIAAGNLLALGIYVNGDSGSFVTITSVDASSCQSNTLTYAGDNPRASSVGNGQAWGYSAKNITGGACTITVTFSAATVITRLTLTEVSGADTTAPLDQHTGNHQFLPGTGTNAVTTGAMTTTANGEFVWAFMASVNGSTTITQGTGFTIEENTGVLASEHQIQTSAGSIAGTFTQAVDGNEVTSILMTFKAAGGTFVDYFQRRLQQ